MEEDSDEDSEPEEDIIFVGGRLIGVGPPLVSTPSMLNPGIAIFSGPTPAAFFVSTELSEVSERDPDPEVTKAIGGRLMGPGPPLVSTPLIANEGITNLDGPTVVA